MLLKNILTHIKDYSLNNFNQDKHRTEKKKFLQDLFYKSIDPNTYINITQGKNLSKRRFNAASPVC